MTVPKYIYFFNGIENLYFFLGGILGHGPHNGGARGGILGGQGIGPGGREGILHAMNGLPGGHQQRGGMLTYKRFGNFIVWQVKFKRDLYPNKPPQRSFLYLCLKVIKKKAFL